MKDASCNSPEDKRKIVQIRATSTKCHISDPCQVGNEKKIKIHFESFPVQHFLADAKSL